MDVAITDITVPAPGSTITIGDDVDITFTFGVVADTLHTGDTVYFTITLPGQTPVVTLLTMGQDMTPGLAAAITLQGPLSSTGITAGSGDICVAFLAINSTPGDADATNNEYCGTYTWQDAVTSIEEVSNESNVFYNGNELVFSLGTNDPINFSVYNTAGQLVKTEFSNDSNGTINFSDLNNGVYIVTIQTGNKSITKKIAKF
ncbi:MAG: T9SS type A sorting domain-containing protein [Flavobacteriales bacterium]|nr:T9SS type A sorting domain-containing protein [Flavobacteriales bacterium]